MEKKNQTQVGGERGEYSNLDRGVEIEDEIEGIWR